MGFNTKFRGATVLAVAAVAGAALAIKGLVKNQELKDDLKEAGETVLADSKELARAAGAVLNDAIKTVKEDFKAFKEEVKTEISAENETVDTEEEIAETSEEVVETDEAEVEADKKEVDTEDNIE